jgi:hypothetical protein
MEVRPADRLVIKDYPLALWLIGAVLTVEGALWELAFLALQPGGFWPAGRELVTPGSLPYLIATGGLWPGAISFLIGAPIALLSSALTVTADRLGGTLTLRYRSLLRSLVKEYPLSEIASVEVDSMHSSRSSSSSSYRLALVLTSGNRVPLRSYYSGGDREKERKAQQLREFMGLTETNARPVTAFQAMRQLGTPSFTLVREGATEGVAWRLESANFGGVPVSRWVCPNCKLPGSFLCLMQRPPDPKAAQGGGGLVGKVSQMLYRQVLSLYGFDPGALPGFDAALPVEGLDQRLAPSFVSLTNDQAAARQCLNPWMVVPLADWVEQHPMKSVQSSGEAGQLIVLFSPEGTSVTWLNAVAPDQLETIARLGVDLVRAQGAA